MNLKKTISLMILALAFIASARIFCFAAETKETKGLSPKGTVPEIVEDISGDKYFPKVKEALKNAKSSIDMAMFFVNFDPNVKNSPVNQLVEELISAYNRGVKVRVILDQNIDFTAWNEADIWRKEEKNDALFVYLKKQRIEAYYDNLYVTTHAKAIVIDKEIVIVGSANWTESSLRKNWEASCLIRSKDLANQFLGDFSKISIDYEASILNEERKPPVRLSRAFLTEPSLAPRMLSSRGETAFDLYLLLLKNFDGNPQGTIAIDYKTLIPASGLDKRVKYATARDELKQALRRLDEKYKLITRKRRFFMDTIVTLLNYPDKTPYSLPQEEYCSIPDEYWSYGWHTSLSFPEKYCFLINL